MTTRTTYCLACWKLILIRCSIPAKTKTGLVARVCNTKCRIKLSGPQTPPPVDIIEPVATPESVRKQVVRWTGRNTRRSY